MTSARQFLRRLAPERLRRAVQPLRRIAAERALRQRLDAAGPAPAPGGVVLSGLLSGAKGVSQAARLTLAGLGRAGLQPMAHDLAELLAAGPGSKAALPFSGPGGVWILHANAPEALLALSSLAAEAWRGRYRIAYWAWELPVAPPQWVRTANAFHEIWAPSAFTAEALRSGGVNAPIRVMPHPAGLGDPAPIRDRHRLGWPEQAFVVLAMGEIGSSPERKNLAGSVAIFREAFPTPDPARARLILKTHSDRPDPRYEVLAHELTKGRPDIVLVRERLAFPDVQRLIASASVLLSPHRAEGFGLTLAESFLAGVPALATGWSGNLEFMAGLEELLIASRLAPVLDRWGVYHAPGQVWADPDIADGAAKLRALAETPDLAAMLASRGRESVLALSRAWDRSALQETAFGRLATWSPE